MFIIKGRMYRSSNIYIKAVIDGKTEIGLVRNSFKPTDLPQGYVVAEFIINGELEERKLYDKDFEVYGTGDNVVRYYLKNNDGYMAKSKSDGYFFPVNDSKKAYLFKYLCICRDVQKQYKDKKYKLGLVVNPNPPEIC